MRFSGDVVWEPRHATWFTPPADDLLTEFRISRVATDPPVVRAAADLAGWPGLLYLRLHGAPRIYYSEYAPDRLCELAQRLARAGRGHPVRCIFDNTAAGAATVNALALQERVRALRT